MKTSQAGRKTVLVTTLVLLVLCALPQLIQAQVDDVCSTRPCIYASSENGTNDTSCWYGASQNPCTLSKALEGVQHSNSSWHPWIVLEKGVYRIDSNQVYDGNKSSVADFGMIGQWPSEIYCDNNSNAGLTFLSVDHITLQHVSFRGCGALHYSTSFNITNQHFEQFHAGLYFLLCTNIFFDHVWVIKSPGIGMVIYSSSGKNTFQHCKFSENRFEDSLVYPGGGGVYLEFSYCVPRNTSRCEDYVPPVFVSNAIYHFSNCIFSYNLANVINQLMDTFILPYGYKHVAFGRGGGLSVFFKGSATNNTVVVDSCYFMNNTALWGAGMFAEFQDNSTNNILQVSSTHFVQNSCPHDPTRSEGTGGGGVRIGYLFFGNLHVRNNSMLFETCSFTKNVAYWGGGVSFYVARERTDHPTNTLEFVNCGWFTNEARLGAAIDLSVWHPVTKGMIVTPKFVNTTIALHQLGSNLQIPGCLVGLGAMYIDSVPTIFEGRTDFFLNHHTALAAMAASIDFLGTTSFYRNQGRYGGAIALFGYALIRTHDGSQMYFVDNTAFLEGGAIYSESTGEHDLISSRNCFIRYKDITVQPQDWNSTFHFKNNRVGGRLNSIYATSLLPCIWGGAYGPYSPGGAQQNLDNVFCWSDKWRYESSHNNCSNEIETAPAMFNQAEYNLSMIPGQLVQLGIQMKDDKGQVATNRMVLTANSDNPNLTVVDRHSRYISDDQIRLYGVPGKKANVSLYTLGPRVVYTELHVNLLPCPPGFISSVEAEQHHKAGREESFKCVCAPERFGNRVQCPAGDEYQAKLELLGLWMGYSNSSNANNILVVGDSPYTFQLNETQLLLPHDPNQLKEQLCGPLNRKGILCGECIHNYGPAVNSPIYTCKECKRYSWLLFVATEYLPLTIFFFILVLFNISLTSGPANAFLFFAQVITTSFGLYADKILDLHHLQLWNHPLTAEDIYAIVYGIWNLNFFDALMPSYCLYRNISTLELIALNYFVAFYPLLLIFVFYLTVWLYNRGTRVITHLCRPVYYYFGRIRRNFQRSIVDAFAAFLLLSYTKFTFTSLRLLVPSPLYDVNGTLVTTVTYYDGSICYLQGKHVPYFVVAVIVLTTVVAFLPILLLVYPLRVFRTCRTWLNHRTGGRMELFLQAFYGCYKDGTESGTRDMRYFAGLYFVFRIILPVIFLFTETWSMRYLLQQILCTVAILLFAFARPYKNHFFNKVDAATFGLLALINALSSFNFNSDKSSLNWAFVVQYTLIWLPLVYIVLYILVHFWRSRNCSLIPCWKRSQPELGDFDALDDREDFLRTLDDREREREQFHHVGLQDTDTLSDKTPLLTPKHSSTTATPPQGFGYSSTSSSSKYTTAEQTPLSVNDS